MLKCLSKYLVLHASLHLPDKRWRGTLVILSADGFSEFGSWSLPEVERNSCFLFPLLPSTSHRTVAWKKSCALSSEPGSNDPRMRALIRTALSVSVNAIYWWFYVCRLRLCLPTHLVLWWVWFCSCLIFRALRVCLHLHFQFQVLHDKAAASW